MFGEDVADATHEQNLKEVQGKGGVFKVSHGLQKAYGSTRVFNAPLAEATCAAARRITASRARASSRTAPASASSIRRTRRTRPACSAQRSAATTPCSSSLEREHKHLYRQTYSKGEYPGADYMIPFGKAATKREGTDVVVVTWGALVQRTILAAQQAEKDGISTMMLDLRTIMPYDWDAIAEAVKKTSRIVIAHEDQITCGFGAEIAARVSGELFEYPDAPVRRVGAMDTPVACCPDLEEVILPGSADVLKAIKDTAGY